MALRKTCLFLFAKGKHYQVHLANDSGKKHEVLNNMSKGQMGLEPDLLILSAHGFSY